MRARDMPRFRDEIRARQRPIVQQPHESKLVMDLRGFLRLLVDGDPALLFVAADMCRLMEEGMADLEDWDSVSSELPEMNRLLPDEATILLGFGDTVAVTDDDGRVSQVRGAFLHRSLGKTLGLFFLEGDGVVFGTVPHRMLVVLDRLMGSPGLAESTVRKSTAADKKKSKRRQGRRADVRIIDLRKRAKSAVRQVGEARRMNMHRWIVRGHWRNQACGAGMQDRRMIYIAPYVKGPDGAPLLEGQKVYRY